MAHNQGLRQQSVRDVTSTSGTHNEDWIALFDDAGIAAAGGFNGRMLAWINQQIAASPAHTNLNGAQAAFAAAQETAGLNRFTDIGTFDATVPE